MKIIATGCEYTGVTSLFDGLMAWGNKRGIKFHLDDHFTIPDRQHLAPEDQVTITNFSPSLKQRWQGMQIVYHVRLINILDHILLGGFHIEEEVYGPLYYYPGKKVSGSRQYESEMPEESMIVHLTARPEVIESRMESQPHEFNMIKKEDIPMLLDRFEEEVKNSWLMKKIEIDTSDLSPDQLVQTFLAKARPLMNARDLLITADDAN